MTATELALQSVNAINSGDIDRISSLMADDHLFIDSGGRQLHGRDTMREAWSAGWFRRNCPSAPAPLTPAGEVLGFAAVPHHPEPRPKPPAQDPAPWPIRPVTRNPLSYQ
jgi:hypothetical protein